MEIGRSSFGEEYIVVDDIECLRNIDRNGSRTVGGAALIKALDDFGDEREEVTSSNVVNTGQLRSIAVNRV